MADAAAVKLILNDQSDGAEWQADKGALFTLLKNLLENAIQHAPAGTEVVLTLSADSLTVRDFGPGVAEDELSQLFNRFWRGEHRRDIGAGLGLAICQEIAVTHHWTLSVYKAEPGLSFILSTEAVEY
jgi:signal transduction histidine kinase